MYRIKTTRGYYFVEGRGYGRVYGRRIEGAVMCEKHADQILGVLQEAAPEIEPRKEEFKGHAVCRSCKAKGENDSG